jgi:GTP-binding protein EngB required for normal cell division
MNLREYESTKFTLAQLLRAMVAAGPKKNDSFDTGVRDLFARLAEDRFNLVVVGRFNRGKSSLMNAILGADYLPTGLVPLTSVITRVVYGSVDQVQIEFERGGLPATIAVERLPDYVTQRGNPGNSLGIKEARIELPVEILRRGFHFIDTPGLGSAIAENTRTTEAFLPEADAILLVSDYDSPLTEDEIRLMQRLSGGHRRLFLILNKQDLVPPKGRPEVLRFIQGQLTRMFRESPPQVHSVSARDGLVAKLHRDTVLLGSSGISTLENALIDFLTAEKRRVFLLRVVDRCKALLEQINSSSVPDPLRARLIGLRQRLDALGRAGDGHAPLVEFRQPGAESNVRMGECSVCADVLEGWFDFLHQYQHELVSSVEEREKFALRGGFCGHHMWLYASLASDRGLALALTPLLQRLSKQFQEAAVALRLDPSTGLSHFLTGPDCELCGIQAASERASFARLSTESASRGGSSSSVASLCLPHLCQLAQRSAAPSDIVTALIRHQAAAAERLAEDNQRYVLKREGLKRGLTTEEEENAAQLTVGFLAGHRKVLPHS